ncbi:LysR substrate-binding domain-containing protein [Pseudohalocynthiibacter aestuariivivens]|uniref:LysR substrate-binding domain-containing protein n=1 Tax=Pseudohalocynthiibacter aestuariivivens TaxID=1591409 RepID=A0ABV5JCQ3_9RHOB|nr:LysR substrate-binding domain-containing protein [Pseudohalocynthiibacter aestuariivivens]MBS9717266.1 LysR family transcriptional regulator [Pseudohalocynthiibacter aestuariivivens]
MNAVKAFEAVVRSGNMARASEELGVSPSAVSHQVKSLETWFDQPLFDRQGRDLVLNEAGRQFFDLVRPAFEQLRIAADRLIDPPIGRVKVIVCPSLASIWLAPRLDKFTEQHSDIDIELHCRRETVDLNETDFDCALRYCATVPDNHVGNVLMTEDIFPVCSPELAAEGLGTLDDLKHHTLLHDILGETGVAACNWSSWFSEVGMPQLIPGRGHGFSDSNIMYEAACRGVGVALGRSVLVADYIRRGRLVRPFDVTMQSSYSWHFLSTPQKIAKRPLITFRDWLIGLCQNKPACDE